MDTTNVKRNGLLRHAATLLAVLVLAQVGGGPMFVKGAEAKPSGPVALGPRLAERHGLGVFGPGGNVLAAIAADGAVTLRDAVSGQTQWAHADAVNGRVTGLAFSPDGKVLASFGAVSASLWDVRTGAARGSVRLTGTSAGLAQVVFSPDGKSLAGVAVDNAVVVWNRATGTARPVQAAQADAVAELAYSPDGNYLAVASNGGQAKIKIWDLATGRLHRVQLGAPAIVDIAFSPDGKTLASAGLGGLVSLCDPATGAVRRVLDTGGSIAKLAFGPDSNALATGGANLQLWDLVTGRRLFGVPADGGVRDLLHSPDGALLAGIGADNRIGLWSVPTGEYRQTLTGQADPITAAAFNARQPVLATLGQGGQLTVWDLVAGIAQQTIQTPGYGLAWGGGMPPVPTPPPVSQPAAGTAKAAADPGQGNGATVAGNNGRHKPGRSLQNWKGVRAIAISQDGAEMATAGADGSLRVYGKGNGKQRWNIASGHHGGAIAGLAYRGKAKEWVSAGRDTEIKTWDSAGKHLHTFRGLEHPTRTVAVSPDGRYIAAAGEETRIFIYDAEAGKLINILAGHRDFVNGLAFSPDGVRLASAGAEGNVIVWDMVTGKRTQTLLGHVGGVNAVAYNPDGGLLASAGQDSTVILWNAATGQPIKTLAGHQAGVRSVKFSPNGKKLVSAGEDAKILVWNPASGLLVKQLGGTVAAINALAFGPDGNLHAARENGEVMEVDPDTGTNVDTITVPVADVPSQSGLSGPALPVRAALAVADNGGNRSNDGQSLVGKLLEWVFPSANAALPDPNQGPGGPILVVTAGTPSFGHYFAEILRTEGLNEFAVADIATVTDTVLAGYDVVILAQMPLTAAQAAMLNGWVGNGGNLIAMRPDPQLATLLGVTATGSTLANGYLQVNTAAAPGRGIYGQTMQYHGAADLYTPNSGTATVATLYRDATTATPNPAVTLVDVGSAGGQAAAFAYDLASSIVYTRQGNPAWAVQERDGFAPVRSDDKFFGNATGDPKADWIDFDKVAVPQADEQQRLLANLILTMESDRKPLPRFWYFPRDYQSAVIMTGDDHGNNGTQGRFDYFNLHSTPSCSVQNWECVRGTSYMYPNTGLAVTNAANYNAQGFELGLHINTGCADYTPATLDGFYNDQIASWAASFPGLPAPITQRHHCIAWSDWATGAKVQFSHGIRLDTSYYFWPPSWVLNRPGFFSGSGMPMRFSDLDGTLIDVYNATSQMTDESGQTYPFTINTLLDRAVGSPDGLVASQGFYGAFTINAHTDLSTEPESEATVASAQAHGVPVISALQMLNWADYRNSSSFGSINRSGNVVSFRVTPSTVIPSSNVPTDGLQVLLPFKSAVGVIVNLKLNNNDIPFTIKTIKGIDYVAFTGVSGDYLATYGVDTVAPTVTAKLPPNGSTGISLTATVAATFSEAVDTSTINSSTIILRDSSSNVVSASVGYNANTKTVSLSPAAMLAATTTYTVTIKGGTTGSLVKDLAGNALISDVVWSFTTGTLPCSSASCSAWGAGVVPGTASVNDPNSVELGVKFKADNNGLITGVRFYQVNSGTTFQATLWDSSGNQLATGTLTSSAPGWQQVNFSTPFAITAGNVYVASYHAPNGNYAADNGFFATNGVDNTPIHLLSDGASGGNGVYAYSAGSSFPGNTFQATNYWVDVVFSTNIGPDTTAPTVISTLPADTATGANPGSPVTATFSEAMAAPTVTATAFELRDSANSLVPAAVAYSAGANLATLTPNVSLAASTRYTATLKGGAGGVTDIAGNPMAADKTWTFTTGVDPCSAGGNAIVCENGKPGNPPSEWDISGAGDLSIQGYATNISVNRGQTVRFKIDTPSTNYRLDIYRMGYYAGNGARKIATVQPTASLPQNQPACLTTSATGLIDCGNWAESASWAVPANATSGIYFAKAVRQDGANTGASHIVFVVRDDASTSDILFQTADTTWQAYNNYGGNSFYQGTGPGTGGNSTGRAYKVSYNRPFNTRNVDGGQDWVFNAEYPMVRWLEANGYNVSYFTGVDSDRFGNLIRNHKLFMSNGHDEYWSGQQRANVEAARDAVANPVNLAFFSGNEVFWKTRWENDGTGASYRTLVCYKETHDFPNNRDPATNVWTGTWRDPRSLALIPPKDGGRPENALMGPIFMVNDGATTSIKVPAADGKMRFWRGTSVANLAPGASASFPSGTLGYEWDVDLDNGFRPAGLVRVSTTVVLNAPILVDYGSTFGSGTADHAMTLYKATSGAMVFGAGTVQWAWGLDSNHDRTVTPTDVSMQQATVNLFADMQAQPSTLQPGLAVATASTDTAAPVSVIVSPVSGGTVQPGSQVSISGTAGDTGGQVGAVEVSVDGGLSWHPATGRGTWSYAWTAPAGGQANIKARAIDDSLNMEIPGAGITVTIDNTDTIAPTAPKNLSGIATSLTDINLTWAASTDNVGVTGYRVERCENAGCSDFTQVATPTGTSYADSGLLAGTTYQYRVRAVDATGNLSLYSANATVSTSLVAIPDTFLFKSGILRTVSNSSASGLGVLANDLDSANSLLTSQLVGALPAGVTLASTGAVTINRTTNTTFKYRANNGVALSLPTTGTTVTLRLNSAPAAIADNCTYDRSGNGSISIGSACKMTNARVFSMNLTANDTDPNMTTNVPTDGVGNIITSAIITATGTGVSVSANAGCSQASVGTSTARASIANNCNGTITVTVTSTAPASPISLTYKALDNLGGQSTARVDTITVK